jgi:hypothetical protein
MNARLATFALGLALLTTGATVRAATAAADLPVAEKRRPLVEQAQRIAAIPALEPLPADLIHPFNPAAFGQPDPEELRALAAAKAAAAATAAQAKPATDRDLLEAIARRILPSGTLMFGDQSMLIFGKKRLRIGDRLTVTYDGRDYDLELVGISSSTFSVRLNKEEITRPIKPGKTP